MPRLVEDLSALPRVIPAERLMSENRTGNWRSRRPVIDESRCTGCLICWKYCPEVCMALTAKVPLIALDYCKGCGICVVECPARCILFEAEGNFV